MGRKIFGIEFVDIFNIPMERRLQTLAVFQWTLTFLFLGIACLTVVLAMCFTCFAFLVLLYTAWYMYDFYTPERGGRRWDWVRNWKIWRYYRDYFPVTLHKTSDLCPSKNYLFVYHPHGIMAHGAFINFGTEATGFKKLFPGIRSTLLSLKYQFLFPFNREYCMALGVCTCSKASIDWLFTKEGTGNAVVLVVGGAAEALESRPGSLTLTLSKRKGFIRMALEHGVPLVPVFGFGETSLYCQMSNPEGSLLRRFQTTMTKLFTFSPPIFHGRGIFNYTFGIMPYRQPLNIVVGKPLEVEQVKNASDSLVNELHSKYMESLNELFESNKLKYGIDESRHLVII